MTYIPRELRRLVEKRASGCCEYCLTSNRWKISSYHVDHIKPTRHRGFTIENNLCYSCRSCNEMKGSEIGSFDLFDDTITRLFNPRVDL